MLAAPRVAGQIRPDSPQAKCCSQQSFNWANNRRTSSKPTDGFTTDAFKSRLLAYSIGAEFWLGPLRFQLLFYYCHCALNLFHRRIYYTTFLIPRTVYKHFATLNNKMHKIVCIVSVALRYSVYIGADFAVGYLTVQPKLE
jgi:hypothetical protein